MNTEKIEFKRVKVIFLCEFNATYYEFMFQESHKTILLYRNSMLDTSKKINYACFS